MLQLRRYWHHSLMPTAANSEPKCWRSWLTEKVFRKCPLKQGAKGRGGGAWAGFIHGQAASVVEAGLAKKVRELPKLQAGTPLPIMIPELLALISVRKEHIKARILWIKMLTNRANYSSVIWIFTQWAWVLMKAFAWAGGGFDDEGAIYVPDPVLPTRARESLLECLLPTLTPYGFCSRFLENRSKLSGGGD